MAKPNLAQLGDVNYLTGFLDFNNFNVPQIFRCIHTVSIALKYVNEFLISGFSLQLELLGPKCCKVPLQVDENCWPEVAVLVDPSLPLIVKNYCKSIQP
ncbi:Hypothetical predicted protein [Olea europaea subsp. europaea]|uniref:Prolamin-like domain-containing protein n=1 Tax=Olea europaea subsp. europaea TaxID=158383 RepID=A0A8S0R4Q7_OLEEU|nr:Hypothetical predicted protein [Olea europaea subsp. europaea]